MFYQTFSLSNVSDVLQEWIDYANRTQKYIDEKRLELIENNYWENVGFNFKLTVSDSLTLLNTIQADLAEIKKSVDNNNVFTKEVNLLNNIGLNSKKYNIEYGKSFKDEIHWKDYDDSNFKLAENIYARGRDFFVTLQDAQSLAARLEIYANPNLTTSHNYVNYIQSENVNLQQGNYNVMNNNDLNPEKFEKLISELQLNSFESEKDNLDEIINLLREALNKSKPEKTKIGYIFDGLKNIKGSVEFTVAMLGLWEFIGPLLIK